MTICIMKGFWSRRAVLHSGALGALGLAAPGLVFGAPGQAPGGSARKIRSCIAVFYYGGPSHLDTFDMKPDAPSEVRGEFSSIPTSVPGLRISEHLPRMAKVMHRVTLLRSMHHKFQSHDAASSISLTGRPPLAGDLSNSRPSPRDFPSLGAILSYMWRKKRLPVVHASLPFVMVNNFQNPGQTAGFLGPSYGPFRVYGDPDSVNYRVDSLSIPDGMSSRRVQVRRHLVHQLEAHGVDYPETAALGVLRERAFDLIHAGGGIREALDVEREDARTRERYGIFPGPAKVPKVTLGPGLAKYQSLRGQNLLVARRLVEAGGPFVSVSDYKQQGQNWDSHAKNFIAHREYLLPHADQALSALIEDLDTRGLLDSTLIVAVGEFGRTPRINKNAGRDHWPDCYTALLAGGGVKGGFVYGSSDRNGAYPDSDPVTPGALAATILSRFGLDAGDEIFDLGGRPWPLADGWPVDEIFA